MYNLAHLSKVHGCTITQLPAEVPKPVVWVAKLRTAHAAGALHQTCKINRMLIRKVMNTVQNNKLLPTAGHGKSKAWKECGQVCLPSLEPWGMLHPCNVLGQTQKRYYFAILPHLMAPPITINKSLSPPNPNQHFALTSCKP